jgi:predicted nucleotidyltransferase
MPPQTAVIDHVTPLSESYRKDIRHAIEILKQAGCTEVFLFGSLATGKVRDQSDIDLAVPGCPPGEFFNFLGNSCSN